MNVNLDGSRRSRFSIAGVMLWIAGIALALRMWRATDGSALLAVFGGAVALVVTPTLTFRGLKWFDQRRIKSRSEPSTPLSRAIEIGFLFVWCVYIVLFTCMFALVVGVLSSVGLSWLGSHVR